MLANISPRQFQEWRAAFYLDPWGQEWEQAGTVAAASHNAGLLASGQCTEVPANLLTFKTPDHYLPHVRPKRQKRSRVPIEDDLKAMAANR